VHWLLILSLATTVPAAPPGPALVPGFVDGGRLSALCSASGAGAESANSLCLGYVVGAVDQILARQTRRAALQRSICLPAGASAEQLAAAITKRLAQDPRLWSQAASAVVRDALEKLYPCRGGARVSQGFDPDAPPI